MMDCSVGEKIMIFRKRQKMSRNELAQITGISVTTVGNYEHGKTKPSVENIVKIALALNVSLDELVSFRGPKSEGISLQQQIQQKYESLENVNKYLSLNKDLLLKLSEKIDI